MMFSFLKKLEFKLLQVFLQVALYCNSKNLYTAISLLFTTQGFLLCVFIYEADKAAKFTTVIMETEDELFPIADRYIAVYDRLQPTLNHDLIVSP